jgi:MFS family permease
MTRAVPHRAGLYLAVLQLFFTLTWTVYVIYLPRLAGELGISRTAILAILLMDQAIFTVTDFAMGIAADKMARLVGRLGRIVAAVTALSCAAFVLLPFVVGVGPTALPLFIGLTVIWTATSSALRAPPLMLLGKYAAKPAVPYLSSLSLLGLGIAGAIGPYLNLTLRGLDPRLPFVIASVVLVLVTLALVKVERMLAQEAAEAKATERPPAPPIATASIVFTLAVLVLALGFQLHFAINSGPLFLRFAKPEDLSLLMPVFWIGFNVAMFPASLITKRYGGLAVMGGAGLLGAAAIVLTALSQGLGTMIVGQLLAGAAWGCILMSALAAALAIGDTGAEGKVVGLMFSALAIATFARIGMVAGGFLADPAFKAALQWLPTACWAIAGAALLYLAARRVQKWAAA